MATVAVIHSNHYGESILYDGCDTCDELSKYIYGLTDDQLIALAKLVNRDDNRGQSLNEARAITHLKIYQNTVKRSGIKEMI